MTEREKLLKIMSALCWPLTGLGFLDSSELAHAAQWFEPGRVVTDFLGNESWVPGPPDWRRVDRVLAELAADQTADLKIEWSEARLFGGEIKRAYRVVARRA